MHEPSRIVALEVIGIVVAAVGGIDALRSDRPAVATLFVVLALLGLIRALIARRSARELRPDNETWLRQAAAVTGESVEIVTDRAVGAYRQACGDGNGRR